MHWLAEAARRGRAEGGLPSVPSVRMLGQPLLAFNYNEKSISSKPGLIRSPGKGQQWNPLLKSQFAPLEAEG